MFEKEAEEYQIEKRKAFNEYEQLCWGDVYKDWKKGAEFGYNKANEWHYVKDVLPKDNEYVLIYTDLNNYYVARKVENHFMSKGWGFIPMSTVIAWKEIVLPELKEIE